MSVRGIVHRYWSKVNFIRAVRVRHQYGIYYQHIELHSYWTSYAQAPVLLLVADNLSLSNDSADVQHVQHQSAKISTSRGKLELWQVPW